MRDQTVKYLLSESKIPTHWVNLLPDLPGDPVPPLNPATMEPAGPPDLTPIFPMALIEQEVSPEPELEIPEPVREAYKLWRPTPLHRARRFERELGTTARIYYKYEGVSPAGSHKPNSAVAQAYANQQAGVRRLVTETGAGQWGSALALACRMFQLDCLIYMVGVSYDQKPYRRSMMEAWGATVLRSPSDSTEAGRAQADHTTGSLGIAISEAVEVAAKDDESNYALGSVLNHVCLHQTVIGQEATQQIPEDPDVVVGCVGGGSNFSGIAFPYVRRVLRGEAQTRFVAAEPAACPTLTRGVYRYDFGDTVGTTPLLPMYTLGHDFVPPPVHAGGLRCGGAARVQAERDLRCRGALRGLRGNPAGPRAGARHPCRDRRGRGRHDRRRRPRDPLQPLRPRPLRHVGLRGLSGRPPRGPRVLAGGHGRGAGEAAGGPGDRVAPEAPLPRPQRRRFRLRFFETG
jgi:tryptophan synthase beta chain